MQRSAPLVMDPDLPGSSMVKSESRMQWPGEAFHPTLPLKREKQRKYWELRQSRKPSLYFQHLFHRIIATNQNTHTCIYICLCELYIYMELTDLDFTIFHVAMKQLDQKIVINIWLLQMKHFGVLYQQAGCQTLLPISVPCLGFPIQLPRGWAASGCQASSGDAVLIFWSKPDVLAVPVCTNMKKITVVWAYRRANQ